MLADESRVPKWGGRGMMTDWLCRAAIGAAGVATVDSEHSDPKTTLARTGAGVYNATFPGAARGFVDPKIIRSAASTVFTAVVTALDIAAGTATIRFNNAAGAATDPANGDIVGYVVVGGGKH
jgi:hypothetical protein